ncbi:MAG: hypothetical protein H0T51_16315 [Pirellulales bacterium]|nr:hypothetical protein [Pirellulales bacterium]
MNPVACSTHDWPPGLVALPPMHAPPRAPAGYADPTPRTACDKCGSTELKDVRIHGGASTRRDCVNCGRFNGWPKWKGATL